MRLSRSFRRCHRTPSFESDARWRCRCWQAHQGTKCGRSLNPVLSSFAPGMRCFRLRMFSGWLTRDSIGMDPLSGALFELLNSFLLLDANAVLLGARELRRYGPTLQRVLAAVGEIDAAIAVASYRAGTPAWTRPVRQSSGRRIAI